MSETPMVEWTMVSAEPGPGSPDIAIYPDGRVVSAARFGAGEQRLSEFEMEALRRFVFEDQRLLEIDSRGLKAAVDQAAASRRLEDSTSAARMVTDAAMDAGTTVIRATQGGQSREIRYHDLAGEAQANPEVDALQRLRAVELKLLEIAGRKRGGG